MHGKSRKTRCVIFEWKDNSPVCVSVCSSATCVEDATANDDSKFKHNIIYSNSILLPRCTRKMCHSIFSLISLSFEAHTSFYKNLWSLFPSLILSEALLHCLRSFWAQTNIWHGSKKKIQCVYVRSEQKAAVFFIFALRPWPLMLVGIVCIFSMG